MFFLPSRHRFFHQLAYRDRWQLKTTTLPRTGMFVGRGTLIGRFESTRIPQMPLVEIFAPVMLRKLVLQLQDRFSREVLEGLSSHSDGEWIYIKWIGSRSNAGQMPVFSR